MLMTVSAARTGQVVSTRLYAVSTILMLSVFCHIANAGNAGVIVPTGHMAEARRGHTATLLGDGRVLIAGGGTSTAELYDASTGTFSPAGVMSEFREFHSATLLSDGKVLIVGGRSSSTAELYDPRTGAFAAAGRTAGEHFGHAATLLRNGKVLLAGGLANGLKAVAPELYDPVTGTFSPAGAYASNGSLYRSGGPIWPTANVLPDGRVLITANNPPEIYDPGTDTFALTGSMVADTYRFGMFWHTATSLNDGTVLVTGGNDDWVCAGFDTAEIYDPASGTFRLTRAMTAPRDLHSATLLRDGSVLIAGGGSAGCGISTLDTVELYDPLAAAFVPAGKMQERRAGHTATLLQDNTVLLAGGFSYYPFKTLRSADVYRPATPIRLRPRAVRR